jgi:spermidine/putrescine transport system permease protein
MSPSWLILPLAIFVVAFVIVPMILMAGYSFLTNVGAAQDIDVLTTANWKDALGDSYYLYGLWKTVRIAGTVAVISAFVGYPAAYFVARTRSRYRSILLFAFLAPFWISFIIRTFSWVSILGENGVINALLHELGWRGGALKLLYTEFAVTVGLVHFVLPYMLVNLYVVLESMDENLVSAARALGANSWQAFFQVTFPLSMPGLLVGLFLSFTLAAGSYVTPAILGGPRDYIFGNQIFDTIMTELNWPLGSSLSMMLLVLLAAISVAFTRHVGLNPLYKGLAK